MLMLQSIVHGVLNESQSSWFSSEKSEEGAVPVFAPTFRRDASTTAVDACGTEGSVAPARSI